MIFNPIIFYFIILFFTLSFSSDSIVTSTQGKSKEDSSFLVLTIEELANYNGKNGKPSYVAIDSFIYDVTNIKPWKKGNHKGLHSAGTVLTEEIKKSPHGRSVLKKLKIVGKLINTLNKK